MCEMINRRRSQGGFTLVELAVVIVVIGVLAAFGVPKFKAAVEKSKAGESFNYLAALRAAQERYHAQKGTYAGDPDDLDISQSAPEYFTAPATVDVGSTGDLVDSWSYTLTRAGSSAGYGTYLVVYNDDGYSTADSNIPAAVNPRGD